MQLSANGAGFEIDLGSNGPKHNDIPADDTMVFNKDVEAPNFKGLATSAKYADLAEKYIADKEYDPGTVVKLGGNAEIIETVSQGDKDVFGVIQHNQHF